MANILTTLQNLFTLTFVVTGNGLDLVGEINDGGPGNRIPTLVLTANLEPSVAARAMEAGARGVLSKVVSVPETVEAIKQPTKPGRSEA